ncbi:SGNH/GDSL hydrolase family protein [Paenarthrobacter sp. DKR-5]|uniref:SGNH/GDSL hydrolase family protein n=1 Tax=Paenarthrobacter sp. DKR-5 TaxID=2835535 RepID=UPI001BDC6B9A|nr:SGNH/GDSL hydrolase family protein [Paenarthrobacter sp. DKR-5]MBT1004353.1 SGNH/GDSL hydrolase family protein [Paenarthrobacter sp. DKR-5]
MTKHLTGVRITRGMMVRTAPVLALLLSAAGCAVPAAPAAVPPASGSPAPSAQPTRAVGAPHPARATSSAPPASLSAVGDQVVVIGDSLSTGYGTSADDAWPTLLENDSKLGNHPVDIVNASVNGSGYVTAGDGGATFMSEVDEAVGPAAKVVLIFGSENDMGADADQLRKAAADTLAAARAKAPDAKIIVVGPPSYTNDPEPARLTVRDQDRAAAQEAGDAYVDPIDEHWIMGQADTLIGPDGDHPSEDGQRYLQQKMEALLEAALS